MVDPRYEEYTKLNDNFPCFFHHNLERLLHNNSGQANWHENLEVQICTEGDGYVLLDEQKLDFLKNDVVVVNANVVHYTATNTQMKYSCLIIDSQFCKMADISHMDLIFDSHFKSDTISHIFNEIAEVYESNSDICKTAKLQMLVLKLLIELKTNHTISQKFPVKGKRTYETVKETIKFIRSNYTQRLSLDLISKNVFVDKFVLSKNFKKITGQTIVQYINLYRCKKAIEFITEGVPVAEAAKKCGYSNMSFFAKTFKKYYGKLPSEFKNR